MFKLAHSLSIAFGFMVACVQSLCGADKAFYPDSVFTSEPRGVAKIYSQIFKNFAGKKQTDTNAQRRLSKIGLDTFGNYLPDLSQTFAREIEPPAFEFDSNSSGELIEKSNDAFFVSKKFSKAHPIRAPSA